MSSVVISGDTSGTVTLQAPAVAGSTVITLPSTSMTLGAAYPGFSSVIFASSGSWTVPTGITRARITVIGGGGAGKTTATAESGGPGGFAIAYCTGLSGTLTITVGVGRAANSNLAGGTSSITGTGVSISATGGAAQTGGGTMGVGTVTTGTALRTNEAYWAAYGGPFTPTQSITAGASAPISNTAVVWTTNETSSPGGYGTSAYGGSTGGAVIIEY